MLLTAALARAQPVLELTLPEALEAVDQASLSVLLSREALAQAVAQAQQSRGALLPNVTLDATQRRSRSASIGSTLARTGVSNRFDLAVNGQLNLLDPQNIATYQAARVGVDVAQLDVAATRETVLATVASAYFQHLRNLARVEVTLANIARAERLLELAERQASAGVATQIDVTRAQAQLATAQQDRLEQETEVAESAFRLKRLLALPLDQTLRLAPVSLERQEPAEFTAMIEETAFETRADYLRARRQLEQNELEVRAAKFNRLPALALQGNYGEASETPFNGRESTVWSAAAALQVPVFDGLRTGALTRLALSRRRAQELRVRDLELAIGAEVRLAVQTLRSRFAQVDVAERSLRLAEDELRLAQTRFEQGVADNREIIEAQNRLVVAADNRLEAIYQYNLTRVELERARGNVRAVLAP
ncbi:MAG TPA: TolC family protein [Candidatus Synoicihabitans sp.]|nr:TolC family protein [Candidatus Synoicihabitans sp.]